MPNRMLRDWTDSEKVNEITPHAERFFTRLIMKVDDYGCFYANTSLLKANLFPLLLDAVREADISRWMAECQKAGLIVLYQAKGKKYLQINDFKQRLDKARAKYPLPPTEPEPITTVNEFQESDNDSPAELETEEKKKPNRANALAGRVPDDAALKKKYDELAESLHDAKTGEAWAALKTFIEKEKPLFHQPYVDAWNLFAGSYKLSRIEAMNDGRRKKLSTRLNEPAFDFLRILSAIKNSSHLKGNNDRTWKVSFDFVTENDSNYLKIIEGNYN
jgi:predicted transcriptional regulator